MIWKQFYNVIFICSTKTYRMLNMHQEVPQTPRICLNYVAGFPSL